MIGKITGKLDHIYKNAIIVDVSGVGYKVTVPNRIMAKYNSIHEKLSLYTFTYVREDTLALYGFESLEELSLFEKLLSIAGVGPKIAINVISSGNLDEISQAILNNDIDYFCNVPGIGRKTAQRIIVDLKTILGAGKDTDIFEVSTQAYEETVQALKQFGFSTSEARDTLRTIKNKNKMTTEQLLKEALKTIGK